jgi:hypothetical protein
VISSKNDVDPINYSSLPAVSVSLELNRQGWARAGDRFIRLPAGLKPGTVHALQLTLTLTQQKELSICINVQTVKFNSIVSKSGDAGDLSVVECVVKILPDLQDGQITQMVGLATVTNAKSLGGQLRHTLHS